jgi:hypothetical protein
VDLLGGERGRGTEQHGRRTAIAASPSADRPSIPRPVADLAFSGSLYVDMIPDRVPVPWTAFSSAVGECRSLVAHTHSPLGRSPPWSRSTSRAVTNTCEADGPVPLLRCSDQLTEVGSKRPSLTSCWMIGRALPEPGAMCKRHPHEQPDGTGRKLTRRRHSETEHVSIARQSHAAQDTGAHMGAPTGGTGNWVAEERSRLLH